MSPIPRLMIAAPASGSGKSVIASGLMAAFSQRFPVQGFKVGPDYIDPMYHTAATGRPSRNLDTWMLPPETVQRIFLSASNGASLNIIEGVMGLFDGYGSDPFLGSSASVACALHVPVILVIDCSKMSGSTAALVHGFHTFCDSLRLAGVICNRVGSQQHCQWLTEAIEKRNNLPVLGCVPRLPALQIPERHLGLFTVAERPAAVAEFLQQAGTVLSEYIDLDRLWKIADGSDPLPEIVADKPRFPPAGVRVAVARDEAFCFYYEDNLEELRRCGVEIVPFSPLSDARLPDGISGLYFGGGYPELYAQRLSENTAIRTQVLAAHRQNMPIYAECGGLMYLTEGIRAEDASYPLVGAVQGWCRMGTKLKMGYREIEVQQPNLLAEAGTQLRGHEFHYSDWEHPGADSAAYQVHPRNHADQPRPEGFTAGNLLASYIHMHFAQSSSLAERLVNSCQQWWANHTEGVPFNA